MAADSMNGYCLSCYMVSMIIILLLEGAVTADILLNSDWEKDLPEDPTGKFSDFKDFVESNFDVCKWIMLVIISAQVYHKLFEHYAHLTCTETFHLCTLEGFKF
ncbi:hypothetical protein S245_062653 [Arachis hypogaea]